MNSIHFPFLPIKNSRPCIAQDFSFLKKVIWFSHLLIFARYNTAHFYLCFALSAVSVCVTPGCSGTPSQSFQATKYLRDFHLISSAESTYPLCSGILREEEASVKNLEFCPWTTDFSLHNTRLKNQKHSHNVRASAPTSDLQVPSQIAQAKPL